MRARTILFALGGLIVTAGVAGVIVLKSVDVNRYRGIIASEAEKATGRKLVIAGDLALSISLSPSVVAQDVSFANAPWGSRPSMAQVKRFEAEVALMPLLGGQIKIERFVLIEPDILLETDAKGRGNWEFEKPPAETGTTTQDPAAREDATAGSAPSMAVSRVRIEKARLTWRDGATGKAETVALDRFTAEAKDFSSPIALTLAGVAAGIPLDVQGSIGAIDSLLANASFPLKLTLKTKGAEVGIDGAIAQPMAGKGIDLKLALAAADVKALARTAGAEISALPPIKMTARLSDGGDAYTLSGIDATVGKSDVKGSVTLAPGSGPLSVTADLTSGQFDLTEFLPPAGAAPAAKKEVAKKEKEGDKAAAQPGTRLFSDAPLPLAGLKAVNATVQAKITRMVVRHATLQDATVKATLKGGRLAVEGLKVGVGGGTLTAQATLDPAGSGQAALTAALTTQVNASGVDLGRVLKEMEVSDALSGGPLEAKITLAGRGGSVRALMGGLNGRALVSLGKGKVGNKALDMAGADLLNELLTGINPLAKSEEYTELKCGVINVPVKDGVISSDNAIAVETGKMNVVGNGTINLKTEELNLAVHPSPREGVGVSAGSAAKLMRIKGSLASPHLGVDEAGVAKTVLSVGAAVATGGLSVLGEALVDKATADDAPCLTALGKKAPPPAKPAEKKPATGRKGAAAEGVGSALKGIFGQ